MKTFAIAAAVLLLSGCALAPYQQGLLYSDTSLPLDARDNAVGCAKRGEATQTNVLGLIATGDASIATAKQNAGITKVGSVDVKFTNVLGLFNSSTTIVCGE